MNGIFTGAPPLEWEHECSWRVVRSASRTKDLRDLLTLFGMRKSGWKIKLLRSFSTFREVDWRGISVAKWLVITANREFDS